MRPFRLILSRDSERLLGLAPILEGARQLRWRDALALGPLLAAPWMYGSDTPLAQAVLITVVGAWCLVAAPSAPGRSAGWIVGLTLGLIVLTIALVVVQYWPGGVMGFVDGIWTTSGLPDTAARAALLASPPVLEALGPLSSAAAVVIAALWTRDVLRFQILIWLFALNGFVIAVVGLAQFVLMPSTLLFAERTSYFGVLTGSFVNRNTAATYLGAVLLIWIAVLLRTWRRAIDFGVVGPGVGRRVHLWPTALLQTASVVLIVALALFLTASRAGILLTLAVGGVMIWLYISHSTRTLRLSIPVLLVVGTGSVVLLEFLGRGLEQRIARVGLGDEGRFWLFEGTVRMIAERPWLGVGFGAYDVVFPGYRPADLGAFNIWRWAHSTPLEIAAEMGLPYAIVVIVLVGLLAGRILFRGLSASRQRAFMMAAAFGLILAVGHSMVDFSLQVPGAAIPILALAAGAAACADSERGTG